MHSILFEIGPLTIHTYGVMMALGFLLGLGSWTLLARREGRDFAFCSDLLFWIMVTGILGARAAYVMTEWSYFAAHPLEIVRVDRGGLVYYGGMLSAGLALVVFARRRRIALPALMDFVITAVPLGHALGRVGCFLNGCCYGARFDGPWAVRFPAQSLPWEDELHAGLIGPGAPMSLPLHPVQLYESALNLAVFALLAWHYRRQRVHDGQTLALYLLTYPLGRLALEFLRGHEQVWVGVLTDAQVVSLGLLGVGLLLALRAARRKRACASSPPPPKPASGPTAG